MRIISPVFVLLFFVCAGIIGLAIWRSRPTVPPLPGEDRERSTAKHAVVPAALSHTPLASEAPTISHTEMMDKSTTGISQKRLTVPLVPPPVVEDRVADELYSGEMLLTGRLSEVGNASAKAALQTLLWSQINGDADKLAETIGLSFFAGATERGRTHQDLVAHRQMLAAGLISHVADVGGVQVVHRKEIGAGNVLLRVKFFHANGRESTEVVLLKETSRGWLRDIGWTPAGGNSQDVPAAASGRR